MTTDNGPQRQRAALVQTGSPSYRLG